MQREQIYFTGREIALAVKLEQALLATIEMIDYLMEHEKTEAYVIMLVSAFDVDLKGLLLEQKRETDMLFEIDSERSIYAVLCQGTKIDGGYHFAQRLMRHLKLDQAKEPYCVQLEIRKSGYMVKDVVFRLIDLCLQAKEQKRVGEIVLQTIH